MKTFSIIILLLITGYNSSGQCTNFHQKHCDLPLNWDYEFDSQSMSSGIFPGQAFRVKVVFYEGNDYYVGICQQELSASIHYKVVFDENEFDENIAKPQSSNLKYYEFKIKKTLTAKIEIKLDKTENINYEVSDLRCFGVIIGSKKSNE